MGDLIAILLNFFKISNQEVNKITINMKNIIEKSYNQIINYKDNPNLKFMLNESFPDVYGDPLLLEIVWTNLLSNALKYSSKNDKPAIVANYFREENNLTVFYVQDNGIGFEMEDSIKLFQPFSRLHTEKDFPGNGIGLALVKKIIVRHGGTIWAKSQLGSGATFFFTL